MDELNFITIGDQNFFPFINYSIKNLIKFYPNCKIFIYDWGFTFNQKQILNTYHISEIIDWTQKLNSDSYKKIITKYIGYNPDKDVRLREYQFNQKPICILDCAKRIKENLIYLDGDTVLINPIDEVIKQDFNIGVTILSQNLIKKAKKIGIKGGLNAGVMFFKLDSQTLQLFIKEWLKRIKITERIWIEQSALLSIVEESNKNILFDYYSEGNLKIGRKNLKIKTFPFSIYNNFKIERGFDLYKTKILHFKGRTRKIKYLIIMFKLNYFFSNFLRIFPYFIRVPMERKINLKVVALFLLNPNKMKNVKEKVIKTLTLRTLKRNLLIK